MDSLCLVVDNLVGLGLLLFPPLQQRGHLGDSTIDGRGNPSLVID